DKAFLDRYMPHVIEHLHYRIIDVSSIKELAKRWYPRVYFASPAKTGNHRALGDIYDSIDELRYYRDTLFPQGDGPGMTEASTNAQLVAGKTVKLAEESTKSSDGCSEENEPSA
ncbi:MAG: oligoribonuclease, partial [Actinomycetaceae bacterium]|nr:oligoribonuclease [Actinomycetaceae bacterium]